MSRSLDRVRNLFRHATGLADVVAHELLDSFASRRDERAFEELVRRFGPMVLGVCRRLLRDHHAADDAFQVTFLTLACKASSVRRGESLAAWLHRVAVHVSLRVRERGRKREEREREAPIMSRPEPADEAAWRELPAVLDEELQRLPESLRGPLVLCGLQGKSHAEAAQELGWPAGSLSKRLARGRELLRRRLSRRGFELGAATAATGMTGTATAAVPETLVGTTTAQAAAVASGRTAELSAATAALLREVLDTMFRTPWKRFLPVLLLALVAPTVGLGVFAMSRAAPEAVPPERRPDRSDERATPADAPDGEGGVVALGKKRFRYRSFLLNVAYSPDGKHLAVSDYNVLRLYDAATKEEVRSWEGPHGIGIKSLAFSPDSRLLAVADQSSQIRLWDVATGKLSRAFAGHRAGAWFITFSPDGKLLATAGDDHDPKSPDLLETNEYYVRVWEVRTGKESPAFAGGLRPGNCVAFSPDGNFLGWAGFDGKVRVRKVTGGDDLFTHAEKVEPGTQPVTSLDFSRDGKLLAVGTGGVIRLLDAVTGKVTKTLEHQPRAGQATLLDGYRVRFCPDGRTLTSIGQGGVALWDVESGELKRTLHEYGKQSPQELAIHPGGKVLAQTAGDQAVRFWDLVTGKQEFEGGHRGPVTAVLSPDGKLVVTASDEEKLRFWDRKTGKELDGMPQVPGGGIAFVPGGLRIIARDGDKLAIRVIDPYSGKEKERGTIEVAAGLSMTTSSDGKLLAVGQSKITVYELPSGKEKVTLEGHDSYCSALAFAPDGKTLVSGGQETVTPKQTYGVKLWDLNTGKELRRLPHPEEYTPYRIVWSPDRRYLLTNVRTYDFGPPPLADPGKARVTDGPAFGELTFYYPGSVKVFSPYSKLLAVGTESGQLMNQVRIDLFDTTTWERVAVLEGHTQRIISLAFSADGRWLVSGSMDASAMVWDLSKKRE